MQANLKKIAAIAAVPAVGLAWFLFRPELLFVNAKVDEKAPSASTENTMTLASGSFASYAHETTGKAEILKVGGKRFLRLSNFHTSNGPDVRVLLVKGTNPQEIKKGNHLDLGSIKGNIGDQNYELPADANLDDYQAVNIWCARFSVGFGGAELAMEKKTAQIGIGQLAGFGEEIIVTFGKFRADVKGVQGDAALIEKDGGRFVRLKNVKVGAAKKVDVYLVKKETVAPNADFNALTKVKLGAMDLKAKTQSFKASKDLDLWLYRSVTLVDADTQKPIGSAPLRSAQEKGTAQLA